MVVYGKYRFNSNHRSARVDYTRCTKEILMLYMLGFVVMGLLILGMGITAYLVYLEYNGIMDDV